jgi:hypothetical protein
MMKEGDDMKKSILSAGRLGKFGVWSRPEGDLPRNGQDTGQVLL